MNSGLGVVYNIFHNLNILLVYIYVQNTIYIQYIYYVVNNAIYSKVITQLVVGTKPQNLPRLSTIKTT